MTGKYETQVGSFEWKEKIRQNAKTNINRNAWTKFFQILLSEKFGYKYSKDNEIIIEVYKNAGRN